MTAAPMISMSAAEAMLNALTALLNGGSIKIYTGSPPATLETSASGTLLSSGCGLSATAFGNATDGGSGNATAAANTISEDTNAASSGTAGYFRGLNSSGTAVIQGTCGTATADMILNSTSITSGGSVTVTAWTLNMPDGSGSD